jgi:hypothetical protein
MHTIMVLIAVVALAIIILSIRDRLVWRKRIMEYLSTQAGRAVLKDHEFCHQAGIDSSNAATIEIILTKLAEFAHCDASRIRPDDKLSDFALDYDDDVAMLVQKMGIIPGFRDYSFPLEEVDNVAEFASLVLKMIEDAKEGSGVRP